MEVEEPDLDPHEIIVRCFGEQSRGHLTCFGAGIKPKDVRGPLSSRSYLNEQLQESLRQNKDLHRQVEEMKRKFEEERERNIRKQQEFEDKFNTFVTSFGKR